MRDRPFLRIVHVHHDHYVICSLLINTKFPFSGESMCTGDTSTACSTGHAQHVTVIAKLLHVVNKTLDDVCHDTLISYNDGC